LQISILDQAPQKINPLIFLDENKSLLGKGFLVVTLDTNVYPGDFNEYGILLARDVTQEKKP
jgi:hypothetical protein